MIDSNDEDESSEPRYTAEEIKDKLKTLEECRIKYEKLQEILEESNENEISTIDPDAWHCHLKDSFLPDDNVQLQGLQNIIFA